MYFQRQIQTIGGLVRQLKLLQPPPKSCGGEINDLRIQPRTLSAKVPIHLILKAQKKFILFNKQDEIKKTILKQAHKFGVKIYGISIQKDHIHLIVWITDRETYKGFIRATTGLISRLFKAKIWKYRPFTRIAGWGRQLELLRFYLFQNEMEVLGIWKYSDRSWRLREYKAALHDQSKFVSLKFI